MHRKKWRVASTDNRRPPLSLATRKRSIINRAYQTAPDNIVGKRTIQKLDAEISARRAKGRAYCWRSRYRIPPKGIIVSQSHPFPSKWGGQRREGSQEPPSEEAFAGRKHRGAVQQLQGLIKSAGPSGLLLFAVGHESHPGIFRRAAALIWPSERSLL